MLSQIDTLIKTTAAELGYLEKASRKDLYDKTANAGYNNWTKYAEDFDTLYPDFYNGKKNGYEWCDVFADWTMIKAFGRDKGQELLMQPNRSTGAGCIFSARFYRDKDQFFEHDPLPGDQVFFGDPGDEYHTGRVIAVDDKRFYTIEGNTSSLSGVIANGGTVAAKSYLLHDPNVSGFGRPLWDDKAYSIWHVVQSGETLQAIADKYRVTAEAIAADNEIKNVDLIYAGEVFRIPGTEDDKTQDIPVPVEMTEGSEGEGVQILQWLLESKGYSVGESGMDGDLGLQTEAAIRKYQMENGLAVDGIAGNETWRSLVKM